MDDATPVDHGRDGDDGRDGDGERNGEGRRAALLGAAYSVLVLVLALAWDGWPLASPAGRALEALLPGVQTPLGSSAGRDNNLVLRLGHAGGVRSDGQPPAGPTPGLLPLLLAVLGLVGGRGRPAWVLRAAFVVALGLLLAGQPLGAAALIVTLAALAGLGLATLLRGDDTREGAGPALAVGTLAVALAGGLTALALAVGSQEPRAALAPLVDALATQGHEASRDAVRITAAQLVTVLDTQAVLAFAAMTALLLFLRQRGPLTLALVVLVTVADTGRSVLPWSL